MKTEVNCPPALNDVVRVAANSRIDAMIKATETAGASLAAVFDDGEYRGVVPLRDARFRGPDRVVADLLPEAPPLSVSPGVTLDDVADMLRRSGQTPPPSSTTMARCAAS